MDRDDFTVREDEHEIEVSPEEIRLLWQLACAILPAADFNFTDAFAAAVRKRNNLLGAVRPPGLLLWDGPEMVVHIVRRPDGQWVLTQENP